MLIHVRNVRAAFGWLRYKNVYISIYAGQKEEEAAGCNAVFDYTLVQCTDSTILQVLFYVGTLPAGLCLMKVVGKIAL